MVKALHAVGIEVILDVVYNHTAEGNHMGPILSMRGIDNLAYYRVTDENPRHYLDFTGTGNSLNVRHPHVLQLIMDSLRYWVTEMHVDGFRFDLASTLARELLAVDRLSAFFDLVQQDPVVSQVKLIAEPWDIGEGGYQVGNFPPLWSEWNGRYRDTIRDFWRGEPATLAEFGYRFTGSSDLYQADTRRPTASINFVTAHDGFTLRDLVSYNDKHNEANGEDNRDGESHNRSWNCGVEGETDDPAIIALRARQRRNLVTTLLLSQGVPMLLGGDELGRTQGGNNNAYCQDNELSWLDWANVDSDFKAWCEQVAEVRRSHPVFRRRRWFQGRRIRDIDDLAWFRPDGETMSDDDWEMGYARSVGVFLNGEAIPTKDAYGGRIVDDSFFVMFNASETDHGVDRAEWQMGPRVDGRAGHRPQPRARRGRGRGLVGRPRGPLDDRAALPEARGSVSVSVQRARASGRSSSASSRSTGTSKVAITTRRSTRCAPSSTCSRPMPTPARPGACRRSSSAGPSASRRPTRSASCSPDGTEIAVPDGASSRRTSPIGCHELLLGDERSTLVVAPPADAPRRRARRWRRAVRADVRALGAQRTAALLRPPRRAGGDGAPAGPRRRLDAARVRGVPRRAVRSQPVRAGEPSALERGVPRGRLAAGGPDADVRRAHRLDRARAPPPPAAARCGARPRPVHPGRHRPLRRRPARRRRLRPLARRHRRPDRRRPPACARRAQPPARPVPRRPPARRDRRGGPSGPRPRPADRQPPRRLRDVGQPQPVRARDEGRGAAGRVLRRGSELGFPAPVAGRRPAQRARAVARPRGSCGRARVAVAHRPRDGRAAAVVDPRRLQRDRRRVRPLSP